MLYLALASFGISCVSGFVALFALSLAAEAKSASNATTQRINALGRFLGTRFGGAR